MDISFKLNIRILEEEKKSWIYKKKRKFAVFCDSPFLILIYTVEIYIFCELYLYMYIIARNVYMYPMVQRLSKQLPTLADEDL